ncbi:septal ring lytic transglycosylase RlpA family protein [Methylobacterium planeticum]|uniref:Endolytic peptidoglycan transglycosylase RlpA n=1 Tax=Methylobacterium planeticum TaxID=2615211 RepID=A0A6N6MQX8_9HYPH|nr:septal ring lytic transglycosylase RlpA family protein [Methylobacterium planeticum]KAB1073147.1 septal ring lytic transglycosylase RlpA family protein [Methylobacterium planeticum]
MARSTKAGMPHLCALPLRRILAVSAIALATANCSTSPQKFAASSSGNGIDPKYGVKASPRLYNEGDAIPKGGGRRFSGKPYVVAGRTYVPREDARGYVREGLASWYGSAFHGRQTANGEVFDRHSIAAAHPTLPLPSYARVTNVANGHSMIVRVNDRGPYHADRVMDVSEAVAEALEFHRRGTTRVRVEYVGKASVARSDDRKLMATLRTDGRPAAVGGRSPIMLADLGTDAAESAEPLARTRAPLAFKPREETTEEAPAARLRPAPVLVASAAVAVPPALQPTAPRGTPFRPAPPHAQGRIPALAAQPLAITPAMPVAGLNPGRANPTKLSAPAMAGKPVPPRAGPVLLASRVPPAPGKPAGAPAARAAEPVRLAGARAPAPIPVSAKLTIAKLAAAPNAAPPGKATSPASLPAKSQRPRSRLAEIY